MKRNIFSGTLVCLAAFMIQTQAQTAVPVKWACIGNSITQGVAYANSAYPPKLAALLGPSYAVENDGVSGTTLLKSGDLPYWTQGKLANVFVLKPDIVSIALGTNDSKARNWRDSANFVRDLLALIDTLGTLSSKPQVWLCLPCPAWTTGTDSLTINGSVIQNSIIPRIIQVARLRNLNIIDLYTQCSSLRNLFPDLIHPNAAGGDTLAAIFYRFYSSKATRICCIGNSITAATYGVVADAYPCLLGMLLGRGYLVQNDGQSGAFMQKNVGQPNPDNILLPYWGLGFFARMFAFRPHIITIKLGTNDSRANYWNTARYLRDYKTMIDTLGLISTKPLLKMCLPAPSFKLNGQWQFYGISDTIIRDSTIPSINAVATQKKVAVIDLHSPLLPFSALVPDGVHPNRTGADTIARIIYRALMIPAMKVSKTAVTFSVSLGQTDTAGTHQTDSVLNAGLSGTLAAATAVNQKPWLACTFMGTGNSQTVDNAVVLGSLPSTVGTYYDTVTVTVSNATPQTTRYVVALTVTPRSGTFDRNAAAGSDLLKITTPRSGSINVNFSKSGIYSVTLSTLSGRIVADRKFVGCGSVSLAGYGSRSAGAYLLNVRSNGKNIYAGKVFVGGSHE